MRDGRSMSVAIALTISCASKPELRHRSARMAFAGSFSATALPEAPAVLRQSERRLQIAAWLLGHARKYELQSLVGQSDMRAPANDNDTDRLIAAADAAFRALVGWMPIGAARRSDDRHRSVLDDPLLIVTRTGRRARRRDVEAAVRRWRRSAIVVSIASPGRVSIGTIALCAYAEPVEWFCALRLWITPHADAVWLVDGNGGSHPALPVFRFAASGLEAHWHHPWQRACDRDLGNRHAALAFARIVAAFV